MSVNQFFTPTLKGGIDSIASEIELKGHPFRGWGLFHCKNKQYG